MVKKKKYNIPIIERVAIDKSISLAMQSPGGQDDGWGGWNSPSPPVNDGGESLSGSKKEKNETQSSFEQNPFK